MGEFLDQPARLSLSLREREGNVGMMPDNYQILPPPSNHIYTPAIDLISDLVVTFLQLLHRRELSSASAS
jgi:hypothetical protein